MREYKRLTKYSEGNGWEFVECKHCEYCDAHCDSLSITLTRLAELEDKIENGTLIELLIPYGTELHFLYSREHYGKPQPPCIFSTKEWVYNIRCDGKAWFSVAGRGICYYGEYLHEIGKTVFTDKAEAEQKLKELKEGK